jgi:hypothetical protein
LHSSELLIGYGHRLFFDFMHSFRRIF